jgi:protein-S-isoprenylcysteine O-methyltransferase Ste14
MVAIGNLLFRFRNGLFPVAALLTLLLQGQPLFRNYVVALVLGTVIVVTGQTVRALTIGLDYIVRGGKDRRVYAEGLVTTGVFAHCRNPMYVGNLLIVLGFAVAANSVPALVIVVPVFVFVYHAIVRAEEAFLLQKFGEAFREYCATTPRFAIRFGGLASTFAGQEFHLQRLVVKEYGTFFAWIGGLWLVTAIQIERSQGWAASRPELSTVAIGLAITILGWAGIRALKKKRRLVAD